MPMITKQYLTCGLKKKRVKKTKISTMMNKTRMEQHSNIIAKLETHVIISKQLEEQGELKTVQPQAKEYKAGFLSYTFNKY